MPEPSTNPYDPQSWRESRIPARPRLAFQSENVESACQWQQEARQKFRELLVLPWDIPCPLNAQILETVQGNNFRREALRFTSRPGLEVFAYFLIPNNLTEPRPALLCLHGHGYGVDALVGIGQDGQPAVEPDYHANFALQAVDRGYPVLAIELLGFGRRCEGPHATPYNFGCQTLAGTALMVGETLPGWRAYDAVRALDYLQTRTEVLPDRLGAIGISGGGLNALFLAALDERVQATVVSGYLNTFRDSVMGRYHCIDNFIPGLANELEMSDIAGLVAPRALWSENGDADHIFPVESYRQGLVQAQDIYRVFGVEERCSGEIFEGGHQFHGVGAWEFLGRYL